MKTALGPFISRSICAPDLVRKRTGIRNLTGDHLNKHIFCASHNGTDQHFCTLNWLYWKLFRLSQKPTAAVDRQQLRAQRHANKQPLRETGFSKSHRSTYTFHSLQHMAQAATAQCNYQPNIQQSTLFVRPLRSLKQAVVKGVMSM